MTRQTKSNLKAAAERPVDPAQANFRPLPANCFRLGDSTYQPTLEQSNQIARSIRQAQGLDEFAADTRQTTIRIPPQFRTRPLTLKAKAKLMGYGRSRDAAERLRAAIDTKAVSCESLTRRQHVLDRRDFPAEVHDKIC